MQLPKISIVTPSFNQAQFLEATIQSVLTQNYPDLEYIIIDGGSTDGSLDIIHKYADKLNFWCSEPDKGQYDALNKGFSKATGYILGWLNSDDMYFPWTLKTVASMMSELPHVEWLTTLKPSVWDYEGVCLGCFPVSGFSQTAFLDSANIPNGTPFIGWIQQESTFWRRSLWEKAGGKVDLNLELASDFELWARFFQYSKLYGTTVPLAGFRRQDQQRSINLQQQYTQEAEQVLNYWRKQCNWKPNLMRNILRATGMQHVPKLRSLSRSFYSYEGERIVRKNLDNSQCCWDVESYLFF